MAKKHVKRCPSPQQSRKYKIQHQRNTTLQTWNCKTLKSPTILSVGEDVEKLNILSVTGTIINLNNDLVSNLQIYIAKLRMGILHGHAISLPGLYFKESLIPGNWHMGVRCSDIFMGIALAEHGPQ